MIVLTVGKNYIDIDGYASAIAYRELLKMNNKEAVFVSDAKLNYSVTNSLKELPFSIDSYEVSKTDPIIILDLSNKAFFPTFVNETNIIEIIDHHPGYEEYWIDKLGNNAIIKPIGAVATIIVKKYEAAGLLSSINPDIAKLLMAAILDNTLNFTAKITTVDDIKAYQKLANITNEHGFQAVYFSECQKFIESDLTSSIANDIKIDHISNLLPEVFGQLTIWDASQLLLKKTIIDNIMNTYGNEWILNIISLEDNASYILCSDELDKERIKTLLGCEDKNEYLVIKPAMLRKEIMKKAINS